MIQVLDHWTGAPDDWQTRRQTFVPGDGIGYYAVVQIDDEGNNEVRIHFLIEGLANAWSSSASRHFELIFKPQVRYTGEFRVEPGTYSPFVVLTVPDTEGAFSIRRARDEQVRAVSQGGHDVAYVPSFYSFRVIAELTEAATGRPIAVSSEWHYRIGK